MGKSQSKLMHSMSFNFNKRVETKKDPAEISLMRVHSSSLESVSTVRIGDTKLHPLSLAHSCSADDIQNADSSLTNQDTTSKPHDTSIDSLSLSDSCEGDSPKARGFTQSLPTEIERKISIGSKDAQAGQTKRRDMDCFSDNFITTQDHSQTELKYADKDSWSPVTTDSVLRRGKTSPAQQESSFQLPSIPDSLLQKLSPEEWSVFINFVCTTLGNSLHSSIIDEKLRLSLLKQNTNQMDSVDHTTKQVKISDGQRANSAGEGRHAHSKKKNRQDCEDSDDGCARSRPQCGERPLSLPSLHSLTADHQELIERLQVVRQEVGQEVGPEMEAERRLRSKSQDDCYCHVNCHHDEQFQLGRHRQHRHRCTHRSTRRRRPRERGGHVDVSLDDNCPGLPQNRVTRRSRHHHAYQQKQHTVCERCFQERLDTSGNSSPTHKRRSAKHHRQIHCATGEVFVADRLDASPGSKSVGEGEDGQVQSYMTLQDMKAVTSDFLKGTNDLDESVIQDLKMQFLLGMEEQRKHNATTANTKRGGHGNLRLDVTQPYLSRNRPREKSIRMTTSTNKVAPLWNQLAFPTEPRTGQDSPRTDMAVINLDINTSAMRQPLHPTSDLSIAVREHHPHVHVHHIIHHSQP